VGSVTARRRAVGDRKHDARIGTTRRRSAGPGL